MRKILDRVMVLLLLVPMLGSCTYAVSKSYLEQAPANVTFGEVRRNPDLYLNQTFVFGGTIVQTTNTKKGTEVEIVQNPVDSYGDITTTDESEGRLILLSDRELDPIIFKKGRLVTFAGMLIGTREGKIGEKEYRFPVFEARQIHLWKEPMNLSYPPYYYYSYPPYPYPYAYPYYYPFAYPGPFFGYPYGW
jgi:outer membrane lipoprotein